MRDFSLKAYKELLASLLNANYSFCSFKDYIEFNKLSYNSNVVQPEPNKSLQEPIYGANTDYTHDFKNRKIIILRHDVDKLPKCSLATSRLEKSLSITSTYYFRAVKNSMNPEIMREISSLGHEIGYHYENLALNKGDFETAIKDFDYNLKRLRTIAPVDTICMHGSPLSKYDSRTMWKEYDYHDFDIIAEPYFDIDFSKVLYLTDTGRRWNGNRVAVRDKLTTLPTNHLKEKQSAVPKKSLSNWCVKPRLNSAMNMTLTAHKFQRQYNFKSTSDLIAAARNQKLPDKIMLTFHPQRWTDQTIPWMKEFIFQNTKNVVKYFLIKLGRS